MDSHFVWVVPPEELMPDRLSIVLWKFLLIDVASNKLRTLHLPSRDHWVQFIAPCMIKMG